jgi:predicted DNA-binding transcriptional regulator AlpA
MKHTEKLCGIRNTTIYRWIDQQRFPKPRHNRGNFVRWHIDDLKAWIDGKTEWP